MENRTIKRLVRSIAILVILFILGAVGGCSFVYLKQDRAVFPGAWMNMQPMDLTGFPGAEPLELTTSDGTTLSGWMLRAYGGGARPLMIYYGGNAEEVVSYGPEFRQRFAGWSVLLINYRGYGKSTGEPTETAILSDALMLYDAVTLRPDIDPARVVVMGRSLGTGVAVYVASQRKVAGVLLVSPYDSMKALADRHYPMVPSFLIKHPFESVPRARQAKAPMLALLGTRDRIIPMNHSMRLVDAWGGVKRVVEMKGAAHNNIFAHPDFWHTVSLFLQWVSKGSPVVGR